MKQMILFAFFIFASILVIGQSSYTIKGAITGEYVGKVHLFFDRYNKENDTISTPIVNGHFSFSGNIKLPVLARISLEQQVSYIRDLYLDHEKTFVVCENKFKIDNNGDTTDMLRIISVKGSKMQQVLDSFSTAADKLYSPGENDARSDDLYFKQLLKFTRQHRASKISPYLISKASTLKFEQLKYLGSLIDLSLQNSYEYKTMASLINKAGKDQIGSIFHDVTLQDTAGHLKNTYSFRKKITLLVFWASWCDPCRRENSYLNSLFEANNEHGFSLLGISIDKDFISWKKAISDDRLTWPQLIDTNGIKGDLASYYGINTIPFNILLDAGGKIIGIDLTKNEIELRFNK